MQQYVYIWKIESYLKFFDYIDFFRRLQTEMKK